MSPQFPLTCAPALPGSLQKSITSLAGTCWLPIRSLNHSFYLRAEVRGSNPVLLEAIKMHSKKEVWRGFWIKQYCAKLVKQLMLVWIYTYVTQCRLPAASHSNTFPFGRIFVFSVPTAIVLWCQNLEILQEDPVSLLQTRVGPKADCSFPCPGQYNETRKKYFSVKTQTSRLNGSCFSQPKGRQNCRAAFGL